MKSLHEGYRQSIENITYCIWQLIKDVEVHEKGIYALKHDSEIIQRSKDIDEVIQVVQDTYNVSEAQISEDIDKCLEIYDD